MNTIYLQRRYLMSFESRRLPHIFTDVLVVGAGGAGLRAGIAASETAQVILTTKHSLNDSNTFHAQGGLAAVFDSNDSLADHVRDTVATGCGLGDPDVIDYVVTHARDRIEQVRKWGCAFDTVDGELSLHREGGHSANRIVHANGDATGQALITTLADRAHRCENLKIFQQCFVIDLLTDPPAGGTDATCIGALTFHPRFGLQIIRAGCVILAAGGAGMLWRETTNPPEATADAMAMAFRAGAQISDAEMMQFHPTTLYVAGASRFLISEAVRGEGAYLIDRDGRRFMQDYHPSGELAPRDVVSRAIVEHCVSTAATHVFLDVRHLAGNFATRFPSIDKQCRAFDINPATDPIPVHPAAHYMIGGLSVDLDGRTSVSGLLAAGESACTGLHGANRLASNSLSELLVLGTRCGEHAAREAAGSATVLAHREINWPPYESRRTQLDLVDIRNSLRSLMWRNVGIRRSGQQLEEALEIITFWGRYVLDKEFTDPPGWEIQNMLTAAYVIAQSALNRTETRGVHFREDYPDSDQAWEHHQRLIKGDGQLRSS